jgi:hypothetical protein
MTAKVPCKNCGNLILVATSAMTSGLCVPCVLKWRHSSKRVSAPANPEAWSEECKRSRSYSPDVDPYFDEYYWCAKCRKPSVFTALQQKEAFEVQKRYIHQRRELCPACHRRRYELIAEAKAFSAAWEKDKVALKANRASLQRWKEVLELLPTYGAREDTARIRMLSKLLQDSA